METFVKIVFLLLITLAIDLLAALPIMWLWNWLMPAIFGLTKITLWQAFGLNVLVTLLFYQPKFEKNN